MDVLPGMNAWVSIFATLSPIEGSRVAEEDVGRLGIEPGMAKAYPSPACMPRLPGYFSVSI